MQPFAEAALVYARQRHQRELDYDRQSITVVDRILDVERERGDPEDFSSLSLCYGSWLGELARRHFSANWTGMHEPHPPRLQVAGLLCSPIDAVLRRLRDDKSPSLLARWEEMNQWTPGTGRRGIPASFGGAFGWALSERLCDRRSPGTAAGRRLGSVGFSRASSLLLAPLFENQSPPHGWLDGQVSWE